jgi:hypothetical protein
MSSSAHASRRSTERERGAPVMGHARPGSAGQRGAPMRTQACSPSSRGRSARTASLPSQVSKGCGRSRSWTPPIARSRTGGRSSWSRRAERRLLDQRPLTSRSVSDQRQHAAGDRDHGMVTGPNGRPRMNATLTVCLKHQPPIDPADHRRGPTLGPAGAPSGLAVGRVPRRRLVLAGPGGPGIVPPIGL